MKHIYTAEEHAFMRKYVPGHSYKETQQAFIEKFGWEITTSQVRAYIANHHLLTGRTGRFEKGQVPPNKGKKLSPEAYEKARPTMFKKGQVPPNYRPIGSERIEKDGYVKVKTADPNVWELKHYVVWERANGKIPEGCILTFKDGDKTNTDLDNLMLITKATRAVLNHTGLYQYTGDAKEAAIQIANLKRATHHARKRRKKEEPKI